MSADSSAKSESARPPPTTATFAGKSLLLHDHLCALYRGPSERKRLMLDFIAGGLDRGERCLCIAARCDISQLTSVLSRRECDGALLECAEHDDAGTADCSFKPEAVADAMNIWSTTTFEDGGCHSGRVIADMTWAASDTSPLLMDDLARFGQEMTEWAQSRRQIGVSMYDLDAFGGALVPTMISTHSKLWICGMTMDNPYANVSGR